ncbi:MAG: hypothetical protein U0997_00005 [Sulfurimicrobium sp.]|nr:hypothetical protein [Sulfurimicrobium sp.]
MLYSHWLLVQELIEIGAGALMPLILMAFDVTSVLNVTLLCDAKINESGVVSDDMGVLTALPASRIPAPQRAVVQVDPAGKARAEP